MKKLTYCFILLISLIKVISNIEVKGKVLSTIKSDRNPDVNIQVEQSDNLKIYLEGRKTYVTSKSNKSGDFVFEDVEDGMYTVYVVDYFFEYDTFVIEVKDNEVKAYQKNHKKGRGFKQPYPLRIKPISKIMYEEPSMDMFSSILKSPYMIVIGLTVVMFLCMQMVPKDQLQEQFNQMNKQMHQYQKGFTNTASNQSLGGKQKIN